jgi:hypothetical protein
MAMDMDDMADIVSTERHSRVNWWEWLSVVVIF